MDNNQIKYKIPVLNDFEMLFLDTLNNKTCLKNLCCDNIGETLDDLIYNEGKEVYVSPIEVKTIEIVQKYSKAFQSVLEKTINEINVEYIKFNLNKSC